MTHIGSVKPDFSGEYHLDRAASVLSENASAFVSAVLRIEHEDPSFRCAARFVSATDAVEFSFERFTDDRHAGTPGASRCYWDGDVLASEDHIGSADAPVIMTWRYQLTDGGRRMRAVERIRGAGRDQDNVWEFARQASASSQP
jgi:hypothetical protein